MVKEGKSVRVTLRSVWTRLFLEGKGLQNIANLCGQKVCDVGHGPISGQLG